MLKLRYKRKNRLTSYLVILALLSLVSIIFIINSSPKEIVVKPAKRIRPPKHFYKNKVSVVREKVYGQTLDENDEYGLVNDQKENDDINIMSQFRKYIMNTISSVNELKNMNLLREKTELHHALWVHLFGNDIYTSDHILKSLLKLQDENSALVNLFNKVHKNLYPWLYGKKFLAIDELLNSYHGRGIVICTGSIHFRYAQSTIDTLRHLIKTKLPIEVFYNGSDDLTIEEQQTLLAYPNVYVSNIEDYFNTDLIKCRKWAIKPFAMLASRFREVILIDADAVYLRDPTELFRFKGYEETGTLFFRDRTMSKPEVNDSLSWFKEWAKNPLIETKSSRFWNGLTIHEMDSSTVVINKEKAILGLLAVCKLNEYTIREGMVYHHVYGDKETFWMGFDMARQHYYMNEQPISFIGYVKTSTLSDGTPKQMLCGHIAHSSDDGKIIFWNGHLVEDKSYNNTSLLNFEAYIVEKDDNKSNKWTYDPVCYIIDNEEDIIPLADDDRVFINMIKEREYQHHIILD